jgi:PAS domain S-box-containing protein
MGDDVGGRTNLLRLLRGAVRRASLVTHVTKDETGRTERRRSRQDHRSPMALLEQMPALVLLERFPVPVLAVAESGAILFANSAFAEMLGHSADAVRAMNFADIFSARPAGESATSIVRDHAGMIVDLVDREGSVVRAQMSRSALLRGDDPVALATFQDLTERLWVDEL